MRHEELKQSVFCRAHGKGAILGGDPMPDRIQRQAFHFNRAVYARRRRTPKHGFQAGDQFPGAERFGDVIIGTNFQALDLVVFLRKSAA